MTSNGSRRFNIHIVEDHNDVLEYIYKEIGSKRLSFSNLTMIHFDSHPDLGIPIMNAEDIFKKDKLIESLSIENWIIPAVYAGHLSDLIWIKPYWSNQIAIGKYEIIIGKEIKSNEMKCNSRETYFLSDNMYAPIESLVNKKTLNLYVCSFDEILNNRDVYLETLIKNSEFKNLILDIDLDFFSTKDPFKEMLKNDENFDLFKNVYLFPIKINANDSDFNAKYEDYKQSKFNRMGKIKNFINGISEEMEDGFEKLKQIIEINKIDFELLHSYGSCIDEFGLPHHVTNELELEKMIDQFKIFIEKYFLTSLKQPSVVTIARSSLDDYCPNSQVDLIQNETLSILEKYFVNNIHSINQNY